MVSVYAQLQVEQFPRVFLRLDASKKSAEDCDTEKDLRFHNFTEFKGLYRGFEQSCDQKNGAPIFADVNQSMAFIFFIPLIVPVS